MVKTEQLMPTRLIESDAPRIIEFALATIRDALDDIDKAVRLYNAVRDQIIYDPYDRLADPQSCSALRALERGRGLCIPKAGLLVACARAVGIAGRLGFADVQNHLSSKRMIEANNGNIFRWHSYAELYLNEKWVKATPAFDAALCKRARIQPLDFDGHNDSVFHPFDGGRKHMEYILDRGSWDEVPFETMLETWKVECPALLEGTYYERGREFAEEVHIA